MPSRFPDFNDKEFDLLKKLTYNTALLADSEGADINSVTGTAGKVLANNTSSTPQTGAVILTLPAAVTGLTSLAATSIFSAILDSNAATDVTIKRNGTTGITLGAASLVTLAGALTITGALSGVTTASVSGLYTHSLSSDAYDIGVNLTNTSAGTTASTALQLTNNSGNVGLFRIFGSGFTTSTFQVADSILFYTNTGGGFHFSGATKFWNGITNVGNITLSGASLITKVGGAIPLITTSTAITSGAGASLGTLTNAPAAGNPTSWVPINDNGTTRYIPAW